MRIDCVIAADIGTTGIKAAIVGRDGEVYRSAYSSYPTKARGPTVEQDPRDWWEACVSAFSELSAARNFEPSAIVLSGQMQDLVIVGPSPEPMAILYSDARASAESEELERRYGRERHEAEARNLQDACGIAPKLLWLSRNAPSQLRGARRIFFGAHDYIAWRLCGAEATDLTTASTTGLLLFDEGRWNEELISLSGLTPSLMPRLADALSVVGTLLPEVALATGLPELLPVFHGAGDAASSTLGAGAGLPGKLSINLGTSGWISMTSLGPAVDPASGAFNLRHPDERYRILIGATAMAAGNYDWLRRLLQGEDDRDGSFARLNAGAEAVPAGSGGLLYLPYLAGERMPFKDPAARGCFIGLGRETGAGELARATLEGVCFSLFHAYESFGLEGPIREISLVGGGARSPLWCRIMASVFDCPVRVPSKPEDAGLRGAAILAGRALGWFDSWDPGVSYIRIEKSYEPEPSWAERYRGIFRIFRDLHGELSSAWEALSQYRS